MVRERKTGTFYISGGEDLWAGIIYRRLRAETSKASRVSFVSMPN